MDIQQKKFELYSYGRRDSLKQTRFLLVRMSCDEGKETFKRITLPGGCTIDSLKKIVENAMKKGHVIDVLTLPDLIPIRTEDQVQALAQSQKVEVLFENEDQKIHERKFSLAQNIGVNDWTKKNGLRLAKANSMIDRIMNTNSEDQRLELNNSRKIMRSKKDIYLNNNFQENHTITNGLNQEYEYCEVQTRKDQSNDALKDRKNGKQSKEVYCKIVLQNNGCFKCILKDDHQNQNNADCSLRIHCSNYAHANFHAEQASTAFLSLGSDDLLCDLNLINGKMDQIKNKMDELNDPNTEVVQQKNGFNYIRIGTGITVVAGLIYYYCIKK